MIKIDARFNETLKATLNSPLPSSLLPSLQLASRRRFQRVTAYVTQEDIFHPTSTVKEAVLFQANLRLDRRMPAHEKDALALRLIEDVGLKGKENTYVGGPLPGGLRVRGLSGGEKRRLSLCCGTVTAPSLLFLDEPTSGLDGFAALVVMRLLKKYCQVRGRGREGGREGRKGCLTGKLVKQHGSSEESKLSTTHPPLLPSLPSLPPSLLQRGMMVTCTIHQPWAAIWTQFESELLFTQHPSFPPFPPSLPPPAWHDGHLHHPPATGRHLDSV